jgi:hypothetical protein
MRSMRMAWLKKLAVRRTIVSMKDAPFAVRRILQLSCILLVWRGKLVTLAVSPPYGGSADLPIDAALTMT